MKSYCVIKYAAELSIAGEIFYVHENYVGFRYDSISNIAAEHFYADIDSATKFVVKLNKNNASHTASVREVVVQLNLSLTIAKLKKI